MTAGLKCGKQHQPSTLDSACNGMPFLVFPTNEDEQLVLRLLRKLLDESYVDYGNNGPAQGIRLCVDGSTYEATQEELDALDRWMGWGEK